MFYNDMKLGLPQTGDVTEQSAEEDIWITEMT